MIPRYRFQDYLHTDTLDYLLDDAPVSVRYLTRLNILREPKFQLRLLKEKIYEDNLHLLRQQEEDGIWRSGVAVKAGPRREALEFLNHLQRLHYFQDQGFDNDDSAIMKGIVAAMKMAKADGRFPLAYQHHGLALTVLIRFGLRGNPHLEKGFRWIIKRQRKDGGWLHPTVLSSGRKPSSEPRSCIWTTLQITEALVAHTRFRKLPCTHKAIQFLLKNALRRNHKTFFGEPAAWDHLAYGYDGSSSFRGGTLKFLEAMTTYGGVKSDKTVHKMVEWLRDQQLRNGLFPAIVKMDKRGDPFVTYRVTRMLFTYFS